MYAKSIALLAPLLVLAACGGGNEGENAPLPDLQGIWYKTIVTFTQNDYPSLFVQTGSDVVRTECDRSTTRLRLEAGVLVGSAGIPYSLQPSGDGVLLGRGGASAGADMRRRSRATMFDSGKVSLALPPLLPLQATQDVCAGKFFSYLGTNVTGIPTEASVLITAPYQGEHLEIRMTLPVRTNGSPPLVRTGEFAVRDRAGFLQNPDNSIQVELRSPAYGAVYGQNAVQLSAGNVRVSTLDNSVYSFEGSMSTITGAPVSFSAEVMLYPKL